jgi:quercetin dioxygenase-like cupin family protein
MNTQNRPNLVTLNTGESFKIHQVTGRQGMVMPSHYSTKEAVVIVLEGTAHLKIDETEHLLESGSTFIIPANKNHTLTLQADFKAVVIMPNDSDIKFVG